MVGSKILHFSLYLFLCGLSRALERKIGMEMERKIGMEKRMEDRGVGLIGLSHMKIPTFSVGMITHRDSALKSYSLPV